MANNLDWTAEPVRDRVAARRRQALPGEQDDREGRGERPAQLGGGISYTEFSYQILQALDFLELYRRHGCTLQTGGSDQWGNLTAGLDLIHRVEARRTHALATPLITKADGTKFGKTEGGHVWLAPPHLPVRLLPVLAERRRRDVVGYLKIFSLLGAADEIEALERPPPIGRPPARPSVSWPRS
jgi:tyrosyl-tRNA synthetase